MTTTYHNNDAGGTAFAAHPAPPVGGVDRPPEAADPHTHAVETRLQNRPNGGG